MTKMTETFKRACLGIALVSTLAACSQVPEGHVGLPHSRWNGQYDTQLDSRGNHLAILTGYDYLTAHQVLLDIKDLKPKDKNGVLLKDMDITVAFKIKIGNPEKIVEFIRGTNDLVVSGSDRDAMTVGTKILNREASNSVQKAMQAFTSQEALQDKDKLAVALKNHIQKDLDVIYPGVYEIESVIPQSILVNEAIEARIQQIVVANSQNATNAALETAIQSKKDLLLKEAQVLADVSKLTGVSVSQLLEHNWIAALANNHNIQTVVSVPTTSTAPTMK